MSQPQHALSIVPCACGSTEPYWHGPEHGTRIYCCDPCWDRAPENPKHATRIARNLARED
jgi:hypothetical protein